MNLPRTWIMRASPSREFAAFALALGLAMGALLGESLCGGKVLSPADAMLATESFRELLPAGVIDYEPRNRLLMDPVLQFQPWLEFNRSRIREGRLPLWNDKAGCGAPHLANGQSAVFDPFSLIAYAGSLPESWAWIAWARLWVAGLGMFALARLWGMGLGGRWLTGLTFPLSGFLVGWLLYPVASAAVWLPWMIWASERLFRRPCARSAGILSLTIGGALLGGHIQTSAHGLLALAAHWCWRWREGPCSIGRAAWSSAGLAVGLMIGAIGYAPLAFYLSESPVWSDRKGEYPPFWRWERPRILDMACVALPFAYGSQQAGHPNLARGLGVGNINEAAGGYAGLTAIVALAPLSWLGRKRHRIIVFLWILAGFGACASFGMPLVSNALRAIPLLQVMDHRRLALWLAFGLSALAGFGFDRLASLRRRRAGSPIRIVAVLGAVALTSAAIASAGSRPWIEPRIARHYEEAAKADFGAREEPYRVRARRQTEAVVRMLPLYYGRSALILALLAVAAGGRGSLGLSIRGRRTLVFALQAGDLFATAWGRNPAIDPRWDRPIPAVVDRLRESVGDRGRVLGLGAEWLPNSLMRYGLADPRNYDSIELSRALDRLEPIFEPDPRMRSSRRDVNWSGVERGWDRLREAGVMAIVSPVPPPRSIADRPGCRVERVGGVWLVWPPQPAPLLELMSEGASSCRVVRQESGSLELAASAASRAELIVRQTWAPGWRCWIDGRESALEADASAFLRLGLPAGEHRIILAYRPIEVYVALGMSSLGLIIALGGVAARRPESGVEGDPLAKK